MTGTIFTRTHGGSGGYYPEVFHDDDHVVRVLTKILRREGKRG
jgi:hypothetical protein